MVAEQLNCNSIGVEKDLENVRLIKERLEIPRDADRIGRFYGDYIFTETLDKIWGVDNTNVSNKKKQNTLFEVF